DFAEMKLRTKHCKEAARSMLELRDNPNWARTKHRTRGIYYHGFASFMLQDYAAAEKSLSMLAPFTDVRFGTHARYLLARVFHLADERTEAAFHYDGVLNDYVREKKEATAALQKPDLLAKDPVEKLRVETLARGATPDHVIRAFFYSAVLFMEAGRFGDAKERLQPFVKGPSTYALTPEALL